MVKEYGRYYMLIQKHYDDIKRNFSIAYSRATGEQMDDDVFHDTLIKCAELVDDENMNEGDLLNYTYMSLKNNMLRDKNYARNKYRTGYDDRYDYGQDDITDYWDVRCRIKDYIIENWGETAFEECCRWIIDRLSVGEIEEEFHDTGLYYKFRKIKDAVLDKFGNDLYDLPKLYR